MRRSRFGEEMGNRSDDRARIPHRVPELSPATPCWRLSMDPFLAARLVLMDHRTASAADSDQMTDSPFFGQLNAFFDSVGPLADTCRAEHFGR